LTTTTPKETSYAYGADYQARLAEKYENRDKNHWKYRLQMARELMERYVAPRLSGTPAAETVVVDVGCSIGTLAIEFSKLGYRACGIDFDASAIEFARRLSQREGVSPEFVCGDVSQWSDNFPPIDVATCFDIFEHLHDDELGAFLVSVRKQLSARGSLIFHTFPSQFDYIFYSRPVLSLPLVPFAWLPQRWFTRLVKAYASLLDVGLLLFTGSSYRERIQREPHCNPLTVERLAAILRRTGYEVTHIEARNYFPGRQFARRFFDSQPIACRNIYGMAVPAAPRTPVFE
jgi:2-polyprenyl-3-methyl-5-hydroxy-6-metoxy-1,4-benzoquinol methylase